MADDRTHDMNPRGDDPPPVMIVENERSGARAERHNHRNLRPGVVDMWHVLLPDGHLFISAVKDAPHGYAMVVVELDPGIANLLRALDITTGQASAISTSTRLVVALTAVDTDPHAREVCRHVVRNIVFGQLPPRPSSQYEHGMWFSSLGLIQRLAQDAQRPYESPLWQVLSRRHRGAEN